MAENLICLQCGMPNLRRLHKRGRRAGQYLQCRMCGFEEELDHGGHRKAGAKKSGDSSHGAGASPRAGNFAIPTVAITSPNTGKGFLSQLYQLNQLTWLALVPTPRIFGVDYAFTPPKIETSDPEVGEIIAWRTWRFAGGYIQSMAADEVWEPGIPRKANINAQHSQGAFGGWPYVAGGIHAWKTKQDALQYGSHYISSYETETGCHHRREIVIGRVALWGNVVEHEKGYRAEFAKPIAFDDIMAFPDWPREYGLAWLRARYGF